MKLFTIFLLLGILAPSFAFSQVPQKLSYQGRLLKADGTPETTSPVRIGFKLIKDGSATEAWSENHEVELNDGFFSVILGETKPVSVFDGGEFWLEISVNGAAMEPRQRVVSVPYALKAGEARNATNLNGGTVNASSVVVNGQEVITGVSASAPLASSGGQTPVISVNKCPAGQVLKSTGSGWGCNSDSVGNPTNVSATAPLSSTGGTNPTVSISKASASANGYLSKEDWQTFNAKVSTADSRLSNSRPPDSGSNFYIQNQNSYAQSANLNIAGEARVGTLRTTGLLRLGSSRNSYCIIGNPDCPDGYEKSDVNVSGFHLCCAPGREVP